MADHDYSPAMVRLLREMVERDGLGYRLERQSGKWWWVIGPTMRPAKGVRTGSVLALARRGAVEWEERTLATKTATIARLTPTGLEVAHGTD